MHALVPFWLDEFSRSESPEDVLSVLTRAAAALGFEYAAYGMRRPFPISNRQTIMTSNYPDQWGKRYIEAKYVDIDPVVRTAIGCDRPVVWSSKSAAAKGEFWAEASSFGIVHGWSSASRGADGTVGLLTLSRSSDIIGASEKASNQSIVHWLTHAAHSAMTPFLPSGEDFEPVLTRREIDVLKWTADGKTAFEISVILNISESTVNFHVKNIVSKLGSTNKIQAVAKAALLGMLR